MRTTLPCVLSASVVLAAGSAIVAAPEQDRPGQITPARVWVQNHEKSEAIPVTIEDTPSVQVAGTPTVTISASTVVQSRLVRQAWEYTVVTVPAGRDPLTLLSKFGQDGWEMTGVQFPAGDGTSLVMKRPHQ